MQIDAKRRSLVISPVGDNSRHASWLVGSEPRTFDLMLIYYGDRGDYDFGSAEYALRRPGFKWQLLAHVFQTHRQTLDQYERIWCPDDDIRSSLNDVNRMFALFAAHGFELAQPAIASGEASYESLRQVSGALFRYSPYVEVMCPIFSRGAFAKASQLFLESQSGWGIDWVWSKWFPADKVAIIDDVGVHHTGTLMRGDLYQKLNARGVNPTAEFKAVVAKFGGIDRRQLKRMVRGRMMMQRVPAQGHRLSLWERATKRLRWPA